MRDGFAPDEDIDDPEALRRAEEAVATVGRFEATGGTPIDEPWTPVAMQDGAGGEIALQDVARSLESEGITVGWDPYEPSGAAGFVPPGASKRPYVIQVPASQAEQARTVLYGLPPEGVTYGWDARARRVPNRPGGPDAGFGYSGEFDAVGDRHTDGPMLSDNERMQRMAGGRRPGVGAALAVIVGFLLFMLLLYLMMRG